MNQLLANTLIATAGIVRGTLASAFSYLNTLIKSGMNGAMQFHQEGIAFARDMGMNAKEAQAYTEVLTERTERLAMKYGVAAKQVQELQRNISIATSRQLMLNESQAEGFLQLNKLVGSNAVTRFTEEMMSGMGGQLDTVQGTVAKAYATAAKSGLNAQKVSEKIANNLSMANRLSFRTGIDGLTRMAMQAEKVGMSLQTVESVANNFMEIDSAIEHSAMLNMLGGAAGIFGGNPLNMAYEANYDPEALQKRITSALGGLASFDPTKGIASMNGLNMDFARQIAKALGMSPEEAVRVAKKQAEVGFKERNINSSLMAGLTQEQRDFLINKSNVANGKTIYTANINGKSQTFDLTKQAVPKEVLREMMKYEGKSDRDIMEENARSLTSINEILTGIKDSIMAMFGKFIEGMFPELQGDLKKFGELAKGKLLPIAEDIGEGARGVYEWFKQNKDLIKSVGNGIIGVIKGITSLLVPVINFAKDWPKTSAAIIAAIWGARKFSKLGVKNNSASAAAKSGSSGMGWNKAKNAAKSSKRMSLSNGSSKWKAASNATKNLTKNVKWLGRGFKGVAGIGTALSAFEIGSAIYDAHSKKNEIDENKTLTKAQKQREKDKVTKEEYKNVGEASGALAGGIGGAKAGAIIGSMIAPGIGTVIGGLLGGVAGGIGGAWLGNKAGGAVAPSSDSSLNKTNFDDGGAVGGAKGKPYQVTVHGGEGVITPQQFNSVFGETPVKPKNSLGEAEYIYKPNRTETSNVNGNTITVKDFNINLSGTLKLDGGGSSKNIDVNELLRDQAFMTSLKNMIKTSINQDINGGRFMNDLATMSGFPSQTSIYAKRTSI